MFEWLVIGAIFGALDKIPKEVAYGVAAYATVTKVHERHIRLKMAEIEANAKIRNTELEVEASALRIELLKLKQDTGE